MINNILNDKKLCNAIIKYKDELENYIYVPEDNINSIPFGAHIQYISKISLIKKGGILKNIRDSSILEMKNFSTAKKWYVYIENCYIFYRIKSRPSLKDALKNLINNDFNLA
jgi:hypothetical protein